MKVLVVLCLFAMGALSAPERDGDLFNKFNPLEIMKDDHLRKKALDCFLDRAPCDEYQPIRDIGPRILKSKCGDCTPEQKAIFEKSIKLMEEKYGDDMKELWARYA